MKTSSIFYVLLAIAILTGAVFLVVKQKSSDVPQYVAEEIVPSMEDVRGCYVATLAKDVYSLSILSQEDEKISGTLVFKNFEKDSSAGIFDGEYKDGILFGEYAFHSEGMDSVMQVIFKKTEKGFQRGFGDVDQETGTTFTDLNAITYDNQYEFVKTDEPCRMSLS